MIKAVLFDMDGILFDSEQFYYEGNLKTLRELGYQGEGKELLRGVGCTLDKIFELYYELLDYKVPIETIRQTNDAYYEKNPINYKELMFDGVEEVLKKLKEKKILVACCSSSPYTQILDGLKQMGIESYFDYIESAEKVKHPKPAPDIYLDAIHHLQVKPEECVVYEDSDYGIMAGKKAGAKVLAREDKRFGQSQKEADVIVKDVYELYDWIERNMEYAGSN